MILDYVRSRMAEEAHSLCASQNLNVNITAANIDAWKVPEYYKKKLARELSTVKELLSLLVGVEETLAILKTVTEKAQISKMKEIQYIFEK